MGCDGIGEVWAGWGSGACVSMCAGMFGDGGAGADIEGEGDGGPASRAYGRVSDVRGSLGCA